MLQLRLLIIVFLVALPLAGHAAELLPDGSWREIVALSQDSQQALLDSPRSFMRRPPSSELNEAMSAGIIEKIRVEKFTDKLSVEDAERFGLDTIATYQGWIIYARKRQSDSRLYRPRVLCFSWDEGISWVDCQDMSWIRLQTGAMEKAIVFNGDLSGENIEQIFQYIDNAELYSSTDGLVVTSDKIYEIIKYPHAGNRVNVYIRTGEKGAHRCSLFSADNQCRRIERV